MRFNTVPHSMNVAPHRATEIHSNIWGLLNIRLNIWGLVNEKWQGLGEYLSGLFDLYLLQYTGCPKIIVHGLRGYCGGAVDSITLVITQLHSSNFNLEFKTMRQSI